ncbi:hypothetical protein EC988_005058, partial [Linderina pennispora]
RTAADAPAGHTGCIAARRQDGVQCGEPGAARVVGPRHGLPGAILGALVILGAGAVCVWSGCAARDSNRHLLVRQQPGGTGMAIALGQQGVRI